MDLSKFQQTPHRRFNPLTREWVLVSPHRTLRPWQGKVENLPVEDPPRYDPGCYLCPGNSRAAGAGNPNYNGTFVFDNDFAALLPDLAEVTIEDADLLIASTERGLCRVGCFSPRHDLTIPRMNLAELRQVVEMWIEQYSELGAIPWIKHVQVFENRGALMGASNPHPHCQIWANAHLPNESSQEQIAFSDYQKAHGKCLLCDYLRLEQEQQQRIICENEAFAVLVPFWAVWPFETLLVSKNHAGSMADLNDGERNLLGDILKQVTTRYDNLFETSFPYSMGFHQQPTDGLHPEWHLHAHYFPPLLRSATIQKFMVGYEMLATPQRDLTPESAAERLRELSAIHYRDTG
ncbi:MAG: UDP-glucose--hexose-1-phosphate uridylyltransferase [Terriglobales bacterium]